MKIGLLEFATRPQGETASHHLRRVLALANRAEQTGLSHFWLVEHQEGGESWGCPTPALATIAANTTKIRVGLAGVLLRYHNAYSVASDFALLELMFPNRIDLGIARAAIPSDATAAALLEGANSTGFEQRLHDLLGFLGALERQDLSRPQLVPSPETLPRIWLLGTTSTSSQYAAKLGLPYAHSLFVPHPDASSISTYISQFCPSSLQARPYSSLAVAGLCLRDAARCKSVLASAPAGSFRIIGNREVCRRALYELVSRYEVDELTFVICTAVHAEQVEAMHNFAEICSHFGLL